MGTPTMQVKVADRNGKTLIDSVAVSGSLTGLQLKELLASKWSELGKKYQVHQQWYGKSAERGTPAIADNATLSASGIEDNDTIYFKDIGPQIGYRTVFIIEYGGPIVIWFLLALIFGARSSTQQLAEFMWIAHFVKREYETFFVHRFSLATMPIFNLWKNCAHYWGAAFYVGIWVNRSGFSTNLNLLSVIGFIIWAIAEYGNYVSHVTLMNLRPPGSTVKGVPKGGLFEYVSCANYTYEVLGWIGFSLVVRTLPAWIFTILGAGQMFMWAQKKHAALKKMEGYPKGRKIMIPFVI